MEILNAFSLAWAGIVTNKGRYALTMLGIIIGVASVIIIISVGDGVQNLIYSQIRSLGSNLVGVLPGKASDNGPPVSTYGIVVTTLKYEDALAFIDSQSPIPHMLAVTAYARGQARVSFRDKTADAPFNGVMAMYPRVIDQKIEKGRFFNAMEEKDLSRVVVLGHRLKDDLFGHADALNQMIKINNEKFRVIGWFAQKGIVTFQNLDEQLYLPIKTAQKILLGTSSLGLIRAKIDDDKYVGEVMENMRKTLRIRHRIINPDDDDFTVLSANRALSTIENVTNVIKMALVAVAAISLLVGGVGIMNIMLVVVTERTREIGLRKALGARPYDIRGQFLTESLVITVLGGCVGIIFGLAVTALVAFIVKMFGYNFQLIFSLWACLVGLIVAISIGIIFGYYPAKKASQLNAIEALRYE